MDVTYWRAEANERRAVPIGRPVANTRVYVVDRGMEPAPVGIPGELLIGGVQVGRGYLDRPALTAEKFIPDPFSTAPGARLYRTGDLARWTEAGELEFAGRMDHQVKVRGFRIEPGEIEAALSAHPDVREAVVLAREDAPGERRIVAYVTGAASAEQLREHLRARLPEHMVPAAFVALDALPLSPNGKVDRRALHAPELGAARPEYAPPRTPAEEALCAVWAAVLGVERVGVHDDYFALGGDSILAIQVVWRARAAGLHLRPRQLFLHPTVAELAAAAAPASSVSTTGDVAEGEAPLTPLQRWFFAEEIPERDHWNMPVLLELARPVAPAVLEGAVRAVAAHHDALRFRYTRGGDGEWRQAYGPLEGAVSFESADLSSVGVDSREAEVERRCAQAQASLDIEHGPLLRALHLELGDGGARLLLAAHHLVMDGVSLRVVIEDLETACGQLARGAAVALPGKTTSFGAWARRLEAHAAAGGFHGERAYWLDPARRGVPPIPVDDAAGREADTALAAETVTVELDEAETAALLTGVPAAYRTHVNDALLAALARAFAAWTGGTRLLVEMEGHGREELFDDVDLSRTVGWFTTLFPVLLDVEGTDGPGAALKAVKEQLRAVTGRGIGHGALRWLSVDDALRAELAAMPAAEVRFEYLGQLDGGAAGDSLFRIAPEGTGPSVGPRARRTHLLQVAGGVLEGRLRLGVTFGPAHRRETVQALAARYAAELRALVAHSRAPDAGGVTPSDFPLARVSQAELDALVGDGRGVEDLYPLGPAQEGILFEILSAPESGVYVEQLVFELDGALDERAFAEAWQRVAARHPALRTAFAGRPTGHPLQVVHRRVRVPVDRQDWSGAGEDADARLEVWMGEDRARGIDPAQAPPMRVALFHLGARRHVVVWTVLHIAVDGWSLPAVLRDVRQAYDALAAGREPAAGAAPSPRAMAAWLARRDPAASEAYWRRELAGFTAPTPLRVERPGGEPGHAQSVAEAGEADTAAVETAARRQGLTLNTLVQGAWALLLARYSGERDVLFGATVSGRPAELPGVEEMVGMFVNTVPVRIRVDGSARAADWLREIQARQAERLEHEHTPLVQVQGWSAVPRGLPLFETLVAVENYPAARALDGDPGLAVHARGTREQPHFPITLSVVPGERLQVNAEYDRQRFAPAAVERLLGHFLNLLSALAAAPDARLGEMEMLDAAERALVLESPNRTAMPVPAGDTLHGLFEAQARRTPGAVALVDGEREVTYAGLDAHAERLARRLRELGVGPEVRVGVCASRGAEMVAAVLAVLKAGGAYVPLDPAYPAERLAFTLADAGVPVLLTQSHLLDRIPDHAGRTVCIDREEETGEEGGELASPSIPRSTAYLIYTSGSTGRPKGVQIEHRSAAAFLRWAAASFHRADLDGVLLSTSLCFDLSVFELFVPLSVGGAVIVAENALALPSLPARDRVTLLNTVPSAAAELARAGAIPPGVRVVNLAGEPLPRPLANALTALPGVRLFNLYGPSEYTTYATWTGVPHGRPGPVSIGLPLANTRVYLVDADLHPAPLGVPGELLLAGAGLARGYLGRPALTAEKFVPDPFGEPGGRLYRTGDLGRWSESAGLQFLGRIDHQVKVRGFRIEPGEIEAVLAAHPAVREAAVAVRTEGAAGATLVAYVVPAGTEPAPAELREHLLRHLPAPMVPGVFVTLAALPLSPNGKVDRRALPAPELGAARPEYAPPRTPAEEALCAVWAAVLGVERVGVHDDYFALGGDSILAIQVVSRARAAGVHLRPRQLFQHPTVAALAAAAAPASPVSTTGDVAEGEAPLTPVQRWFFATEIPERDHWNLPVLLEVRRPAPAARLEAAVRAVAAHHDALRLRYTRDGDGWRQAYGPLEGAVAFDSADLSALPAGEREAEVEGRCAAAQASLSIRRGPLLRALYLDLGDGGARLLLAAHHLVMDGVSLRVLIEDLETACGQLARGASIALPGKTTSFGAWARRLEAHAVAGGFDAERPYWLSDERRVVSPVPVDHGDGGDPGSAASAASVSLELDEAETRALLTEVPAAYRTQVNDALLAALARAFAAWTGSPRLLVEMEGHGREELFDDVDLSRTVGWFTTFFPVLLDVEGTDGPGAALKAVKEQLRALPGRGIGHGALGWLSTDAEITAELAAVPAAQVRFEYLGQVDGGAAAGEALFRVAEERTGPAVDPRVRRPHLLEVGGAVVAGRLRLALTYSRDRHRRETVQALAARYAAELRALVAHSRAPDAGGVTPSDFPLARVSQAELDALVGDGRGVEDLYPLGPAQEGILFEILSAPGSGVYVTQLVFGLDGALDERAFAEAWQRVAARHPALRTAFAGRPTGHPLQVVHRRVRVPVDRQDWSGAGEDADARLEVWMGEDRARGIDPAQAPPMRVALFHLGARRHVVVWTVLHIAVDGWSLPAVLRDVRQAYDALAAGREPAAGAAPSPRAMAAWLARRDPAASEAYWRRELAGFTAPTPLRVERPGGEPGHAQSVAEAGEAGEADTAERSRRRRGGRG